MQSLVPPTHRLCMAVRDQHPRLARQRLLTPLNQGCSPLPAPETGRGGPRQTSCPVPEGVTHLPDSGSDLETGGHGSHPSLVRAVGSAAHWGCQWNSSHRVPCSWQSPISPTRPPTQGAPSQPRGLVRSPPREACTPGPPAPSTKVGYHTWLPVPPDHCVINTHVL